MSRYQQVYSKSWPSSRSSAPSCRALLQATACPGSEGTSSKPAILNVGSVGVKAPRPRKLLISLLLEYGIL